MKILRIYIKLPPLKGGMEKHIRALSQWQIENGNDVVLCFNGGERLSDDDIHIFSNIKLYKIKPQFFGIFIFYFFLYSYLFVTRKSFDAIHIHGDWSSLIFVKLLKKITSAKIVLFSIHGQITQSFAHKNLLPCLLKPIDRIFSTGYESAKILEAMTDIDVIIQPSGINNVFFEPTNSLKKHEKFTIITVANLVPVKNINLVLDIAKQLHEADFIIVGEGKEYNSLSRHIETEKLVNVSLLGFKEAYEIKELYGRSDCFLLTSMAEGTPTVIMEAMAVGLPIVCSNAGGMEHFLNDTEHGFVVQSYCAEDYVAKIKLLMQDLLLKEKIAENNKAVAQYFSWDHVAKRITTLTKEVLNAKQN